MGRLLRLVAINAAVFCVLAELAGLLAFYVQTGWLYYLYPFETREAAAPPPRTAAMTLEGLHPYFGPTHVAGISSDLAPGMATNNFGFVSRFDYPYRKRSEREYVVGIFGGSVAAWFCQQGADRMAAALEQSAPLAGREIVPVCLAHEGYKQPQQALVLTYFLSIGQDFDLVIDIDGFNEVALGAINAQRGFDVSMPSAMHLEPLLNLIDQATLTPERVAELAAIEADRTRLDRLRPRLDVTRSAAVRVVLERWYRVVERRYQAELADFDELRPVSTTGSLVRPTPSLRPLEDGAVYDEIVREWERSVLLMDEMLAARGVPLVEVLQPNQYFTRRAFGAAERAVALLDGSPFRPGAEQGYPRLVAALREGRLAAAGVHAVDATGIFDDEPSPVYIDNCCHYTPRGNEILTDTVAGAVLDELSGR